MYKLIRRHFSVILILVTIIFVYREVVFKGFIPLPVDTLVGAYHPWLDYKWGFITGVPVKNALLSDAFSHFYVLKNLSFDILKSGHWPFWNRFIFSGTPLLATFHISALFPGNLLLLLPGLWGWRAFIVLSTLFATLSMYFYLSTRLSSRLASISAAIVFAFAGPMTTWSEFGTAVWSAGFIPLLLLCLDQIFLKKKIKFLWLYSLLLTVTVTAGHVQLLTYLIPLISFYSLFLFLQSESQHKLILLFSVGFFSILGFLLASIQLLPTYYLFKYSIRSEERYSSQFNYGLIDLPQLIRLWVPDFFGHPSTGNHWSTFIYHEYASFLGTLTLPFVLPLFLKKFRTGFSNFFLTIFILSLFLVVSHPLSKGLFGLNLPLFTYSSASRLFFITGLSAAILLGISLDFLSRDRTILRPLRFMLLFLAITNVVALSLAPSSFRSIALRNSLLPLLILVSFFAITLTKLSKNLLLVIILVVLVLDMGRFFRKYNPFVPAHLTFPTTPALDFLTKQQGTFRISREDTNLLPPNTWVPYRLESIEGYEPLRPLAYGQLFHLTKNDHLDNPVSRYSLQERVNPKYLDALNVKYFLSVEADDKKPSLQVLSLLKHDYKLVFKDDKTLIYENTHFLPRAYFANKVLQVSTSEQEQLLLENKDFDPTTTAVLTEKIPQTFAPNDSVAHLVNYQDNLLEFDLISDVQSFLIIANNFDPGWQASLDGKTTPLYQTNHSLQGIVVPTGQHHLRLKYVPQGFRDGLKLSFSAIVVWLFTLVIFLSL